MSTIYLSWFRSLILFEQNIPILESCHFSHGSVRNIGFVGSDRNQMMAIRIGFLSEPSQQKFGIGSVGLDSESERVQPQPFSYLVRCFNFHFRSVNFSRLTRFSNLNTVKFYLFFKIK